MRYGKLWVGQIVGSLTSHLLGQNFFISLRKYKTTLISKYFLLDLQINTKRMLTRSGNDVKKKDPNYNNAILASESISR